MISICCRIAEEFDDLLAMVKPLPNVWCSIRTHPHDAGLETEKRLLWSRFVRRPCPTPKSSESGSRGWIIIMTIHRDRSAGIFPQTYSGLCSDRAAPDRA